MPQNGRGRPSTTQLKNADDVNEGLKNISGFSGDGDFTPAKLQTALDAATAKRGVESAAQIALDTARDNAAQAEWDYYNKALRLAEMVVGQFGSDSNEAQAIGRKKKSERKKPAPRKKNPPA